MRLGLPCSALSVALLATAGLTFAATSTLSAQPTTSPETTSELPPLVVPDVRHQAYVFAKGMLEQGGFAWRVEGAVRGYSANLVASQTPAPGSKLAANGAPTIVLRLQRNAGYAQEGTPEDKSPYAGAPARRFGVVPPRQGQGQGEDEDRLDAGSHEAKGDEDHCCREEAEGCREEAGHTREPAFVVPGAPKEPLDEMTLATRANEAQRLGLRAPEAHARGSSTTGSTSTTGSSPERSSAGRTARSPCRLSSPSTSASRPSGASAATARRSPGRRSSDVKALSR